MAPATSIFDEESMELVTWPITPHPLTPPATDPYTGPFVCAHIPLAYLPYVIGALGSLMQPGYWLHPDDATLTTTLGYMDTLISNIDQAEPCPEVGMVSVSIAMGAATGTATVTFTTAFATTPTVVVSTEDGTVIPSWESVSTTGFTARITSNVTLPAGLTTNVSWIAST